MLLLDIPMSGTHPPRTRCHNVSDTPISDALFDVLCTNDALARRITAYSLRVALQLKYRHAHALVAKLNDSPALHVDRHTFVRFMCAAMLHNPGLRAALRQVLRGGRPA